MRADRGQGRERLQDGGLARSPDARDRRSARAGGCPHGRAAGGNPTPWKGSCTPVTIFILAVDHRDSLRTWLGSLGVPAADTDRTARSLKTLCVRALDLGRDELDADEMPMLLLDEEYGVDAITEAKSLALQIVVPVERSGQAEFLFEHGDDFRRAIEAVDPDAVKALVRYNPAGDAATNRRSRSRLVVLQEYLRGSGRRFMLELLVPATAEQRAAHDGDRFDEEIRPALTATAIEELPSAGLRPVGWARPVQGSRGGGDGRGGASGRDRPRLPGRRGGLSTGAARDTWDRTTPTTNIRRTSRSGDRDPHVPLRPAFNLNQANDNHVSILRLLQGQNSNPRIADRQERKLPSECALMLCGFERDQRIVQALRLPVCLTLPPVFEMSGDAIDEFMMTKILSALVRITSACPGRSNQRQSNRMIVRLIRSVLAVSQNCCPERATRIGQIDPLVCRHFELLWLRTGPLDRANIPVIGRHLVRRYKRKSRLQIRFFAVPVNYVCELNALSRIARGKADGLHKPGSRGLSRHFHRHACRTIFHNSNLRRTADISFRCGLLLLPIHVPCRPVLRVVIGNRQARRGAQQFFA